MYALSQARLNAIYEPVEFLLMWMLCIEVMLWNSYVLQIELGQAKVGPTMYKCVV